MNTLEIVLRLVAGVGLIFANGFFVAIEFALTRARQFTESEFVGGNPKLERAWEMTNDLELYLTTCQVGITASSIAVGIVAEPALAAIFEPLFVNSALASVGAGAIIAFLIINLVHLTHGEQTPTYLGVERSRWVCRYGATPLYWFQRLISPLISLGDSVAKWTLKLFGVEMTGAWLETEEDVIESRAELRTRLSSVLDRGDLSQERVAEVLSALTAGDTPVSSVMVPSDEVTYLRIGETEKNIERLSDGAFTRYPLVGDSPEDFHGVVYIPSVINHIDELRAGETTFEELATEPMVLSPETSVSDAIDQFQTRNQELALVLGDGEVVGLLTATDALESVMGEIEDPYDVDEGTDGTDRGTGDPDASAS